jgi:hypothetical protein
VDVTTSPEPSGAPAAPEAIAHRRQLADEGDGPALVSVEAGAAPTIVMVDRAGVVLDAAPTCAALLGTSDAVGRALTSFVAEDERGALDEMIALALGDDGRRARAFETTLTGRRADGLPLIVRASAPGGMDTSAAAIVLERWGGPVTYAGEPGIAAPPRSGPDHLLSHDARGAVRNTRNFSGIFARKVRSSGPDGGPPLDAAGEPIAFDLLETALRSAANADEMLERIVWFIRLEHEPLVVQPATLEEIVELATQKAETTGQELADAHDAPDLAGPTLVHVTPDAAPIEVLGNTDLLAWCFAELIVNARKFAGAATEIAVRAQAHGGWVHVEVESTGKAVDPELAEDAFRLGRMLQPRGDRPGVGMGLPLLRRIVTRHAGRVAIVPTDDVTSETTSFRLRLPAVVPENLV